MMYSPLLVSEFSFFPLFIFVVDFVLCMQELLDIISVLAFFSTNKNLLMARAYTNSTFTEVFQELLSEIRTPFTSSFCLNVEIEEKLRGNKSKQTSHADEGSSPSEEEAERDEDV